MAFLTWKPEYDLNIEAIDRQHHHLVQIINRLHDGMLQGAPKPVLQGVLSDLVSYTRIHFETEEQLMLAKGYGGYTKHRGEHKVLAEKVTRFEQDLASGKVALSIPLMNFLKMWLTEHILRSDRAYALYLGRFVDSNTAPRASECSYECAGTQDG